MKTGPTAVVHDHLQHLLRHLRRARRGDPRAIHQARVASRRLREALPVAAAGAAAPRAATRDMRRVTRALGAVRELDVALAEVARDRGAHPWPPGAVARVRDHLTIQREQAFERMHLKLERLDADRLDACASKLDGTVDEAAWRKDLAARVRRRAARFAAALAASGTMYVADPIHRVRIAGKKLRYTLELARVAARAPVGRELAMLKRTQDLLGRLRDLQLLQEHVRQVSLDTADRDAAAGLRTIENDLAAECRRLHAQFVDRGPRLAALADRIARDVPPMVAKPRMAGIRRPRRPARSSSASGRRSA